MGQLAMIWDPHGLGRPWAIMVMCFVGQGLGRPCFGRIIGLAAHWLGRA